MAFNPRQVYLVALDHALSVEFVDARQVTPQAGTAGDVAQDSFTPVQPPHRQTLAKPISNNAPALGSQATPLTRVSYPNLWPGINLTYETQIDSIAKSTYTLAPGADPACIRLRYNVPVSVQPDGSLGFAFETGHLTETAPIAWQNINGQRVSVSVAFRLTGPSDIGFAVGHYNPTYPLIIDPAYHWHTFYGSSGGDFGYGMAVDTNDNIYVVGYSGGTWNGPNPTDTPRHAHSGSLDFVILKLNSSGDYQWHTFYGSSTLDYGRGITVDSSGNIVVTGFSNATWDGPAFTDTPRHTHSGNDDIVVVKTGPAPEMAILGNGQEIANLSITPSPANHTSFGSVTVSSGIVTHTFTISNTGELDLTLTDIPPVTLAGASHFSVTQQPASPVVSHTTTTFDIRFVPTVAGAHTATVSIANNDPDENPYTFVIQGAGVTNSTYLPLILKH